VKKKMEWLIIVISISTLASTLPVEKETSKFSKNMLACFWQSAFYLHPICLVLLWVQIDFGQVPIV
jgi:hypothetical protein